LKHQPSPTLTDEFGLLLGLVLSEGQPGRKEDNPMNETTLDRARAGDGDAFQKLVEPHRRELLVHCYRILGSLQDAEDVLQEVLMSAWRALDRFDGRSLRAWLYRIATNRCLNFLRDETRRPQSVLVAGPTSAAKSGLVSSDEPWWLEPYPDALMDDAAVSPEARYDSRESIALSFIAGLQRLPTQQRAVLVLRDVLGFSASEAAGILGTTTTSVNSALVRARSGLPPSRSPDLVPLPRSAIEAEILDRFIDAFQNGDVEQVVALLTDDVKLTMPPETVECHGARAVAEFCQARGFWGQELKLVATRVNNQPAFGYYLPDPHSSISRASGLMVLTLRRDKITTLTRFGDKGILATCGLPRTIPNDRS
jgi:RNA polymerase sigma-70 factor (TIGR02960 family)